MKRITLFDDKERTLEGPALHHSNTYTYLNDSIRFEIDNVRKLLEHWFEMYPDNEKEELRNKFKVDFYPTEYELYIYTLFTLLGYKLEIHPKLNHTDKTPDYIAKKGDFHMYIEVKYIAMLSQKEQALKNRMNTLYDYINHIDASNFLLQLEEITFKESGNPSRKSIVKYFNDILSSIDPDEYEKERVNKGDEMPSIVYEDNNVKIETKLFPKTPANRGVNTRIIGTHPIVTQIGNDSEDIISSLETKASRYGNLEAPYIICLNKPSIGLDQIEVQEALHGSYTVSWSTNPANRNERFEFDGTGFFGSKPNQKHTRVSAVYITNAYYANLNSAEHLLMPHPFAQYPIDLSIGKSVKEIFNIVDGYPNTNSVS